MHETQSSHLPVRLDAAPLLIIPDSAMKADHSVKIVRGVA
jgi:hypothetical protein